VVYARHSGAAYSLAHRMMATLFPVYTTFAGGDGQVGIHGTNRPELLGRDVSHGCIRVSNAVITRMAKLVARGTPVSLSR
jgi:lipoprotein-anchoring transpeptidase ErfK/SrfK